MKCFIVMMLVLCAFGLVAAESAGAPSDLYPSALGFLTGSSIFPYTLFNLHYVFNHQSFGIALNLGAMQNTYKFLGLVYDWSVNVFATMSWRLAGTYLGSSTDLYVDLYSLITVGYTLRKAYIPPSLPELEPYSYHKGLPVGVGIGMETVLARHLSLPLEIGFQSDFLGSSFGPFFNVAARYRF